jgi:O-antigen/teichoic acid export membrane protein
MLLVLPFQARDALPVYAVLASWYLATLFLLYLMWRRRLFIVPRRFLRILREPWLRTNLLFSGSLWLATIVTIIGSQSDSLLVGSYLGYVELAEYGAAVLFYGLLAQILEVLGNMFVTVFPRGNNREIGPYKTIVSMNILIIPLMGLATLFSIEFLANFLLSEKYTLVTPIFMVLSFSLVFRSLELANRALAITVNQPQINTKATLLTIAIYIPGLWALVARIGLFGAAISDMFFWGSYTLLQIYFMRHSLREHATYSARAALLGTVVYAATIVVYFLMPTLALRMTAPIIVYLLFGHALRLWDLRQAFKIATQLVAQYSRPLSRRAPAS